MPEVFDVLGVRDVYAVLIAESIGSWLGSPAPPLGPLAMQASILAKRSIASAMHESFSFIVVGDGDVGT